MTYNEALEYIHSVVWLGSRPGLSRTRELLAKLGNPERDLKFVHVAGTNGKGSTCSMLDSVLREAGYRVGLYTSPYIVRFNERMCVGGEPISDSELAELVEVIRPLADSMKDKPTEFELITALAFLYFKRHECDIVVLEVGMGGALDSTNVIESPEVSVITGIALDHVSFLGNTVSEIASQKAGVIKNGRPAIYGGRDDEAYSVIASRASELSCELTRTSLSELSVKTMDISGTVFDYREYNGLKLSLLGSYQPENAATVIETVFALRRSGWKISDKALYKGIEKAKWRARFELLDNNPPVIFDGSHNIQGISAACDSIRSFFGSEKVLLLMGVLADKDYRDMVAMLAPLVSEVFCVTPDSPRALASEKLAEVFAENGAEAHAFDTIYGGVESVYSLGKTQNKPILMLGSLYMYGNVFSSLEAAKNA